MVVCHSPNVFPIICCKDVTSTYDYCDEMLVVFLNNEEKNFAYLTQRRASGSLYSLPNQFISQISSQLPVIVSAVVA